MQGHIVAHCSVPLNSLASGALIESFYGMVCNDGMTIEQTRRERLLVLIEEVGGVSALAQRMGHNSPTQVSQWKNASIDHNTGKPRSISSSSARRLEEVCGKPKGWMDGEAVPVKHDDESALLELWAYLLPSEKQAMLDQMRPMAVKNREAGELFGSTDRVVSVRKQGFSFINGPSSSRRKKHAS